MLLLAVSHKSWGILLESANKKGKNSNVKDWAAYWIWRDDWNTQCKKKLNSRRNQFRKLAFISCKIEQFIIRLIDVVI